MNFQVKVSLEVHEYQDFFDADDEFYVWIFDPISWKTFILGILLGIESYYFASK